MMTPDELRPKLGRSTVLRRSVETANPARPKTVDRPKYRVFGSLRIDGGREEL